VSVILPDDDDYFNSQPHSPGFQSIVDEFQNTIERQYVHQKKIHQATSKRRQRGPSGGNFVDKLAKVRP
jgi:hypothetical protein